MIHTSQANPQHLPLLSPFPPDFVASIKEFDVRFAEKNVPKVCACQLVNLRSRNDQFENVAIFAEKTNYGNPKRDFYIVKDVLEKEKKHMKLLFYNKIKVLNKMVVATDCRTLYKQLQTANYDVKMYQLLDADVKSKR
jgi:hypothetical protein